MLAKLKVIGLIAAGIIVLISTISSFIGTYKITTTLEELNQKKVELTDEKVTDIVLNDLKNKVDNNSRITETSLERLDNLIKEIDGQAPVTIIKTEVVHATPQKDSSNEIDDSAEGDNLDVALRAVDELWRDFCQRFPRERSCLERQDHNRSLQTPAAH